MRNTHFSFSPSFKPLNHGSFGAYPAPIQAVESSFQKLVNERPDTFIVYDLPDYSKRYMHFTAFPIAIQNLP
jgi:hypothetical protein